jgi:GNAT superfamily N-acetyltransferase
MRRLALRLTPGQYRRLPRSAAYRYSYHEGKAWLNPRPRYYHAALDLRNLALEGAAPVATRPVTEADWDRLVELFAEAFAECPPFSCLGPKRRRLAARVSLNQARDGGDGPWIERASFVATAAEGELLGAILVTLVPLGDPTEWGAYLWLGAPPEGCVEMCLGRPHLTWVFVRPERAGRGVGTALLGRAAAALREMGYGELHSTFMAGNDSSMLWHWRTGFRLLSYPGSPRRDKGDGAADGAGEPA